MASHFDRWEKDPFFSAAEEVQESADRMESTYRTWIHAAKDDSGVWNSDELRRDLRTALGTAKWQLEEFEKAVKLSYANGSADDARDRHREFIVAIGSQISKVEDSLNESAASQGKPPLPWVRLNERECNELALFLSGPSLSTAPAMSANTQSRDQESLKDSDQPTADCLKNPSHSVEWGTMDAKEEKMPGHRRTASASADIGAWKIAVVDDVTGTSSSAHPEPPPRKIPSFSGFLNTMESATKLKWSKNGYRKLKLTDRSQGAEADTVLPQIQQPSRGVNGCYERNKSCLDSCEEYYDKQLYGWHGAIQRQLQRSQYHMQYSRPVQAVLSAFLLIGLIALLALCIV